MPLTDTQEREQRWVESEKGGCDVSPLSSGDMGTRWGHKVMLGDPGRDRCFQGWRLLIGTPVC